MHRPAAKLSLAIVAAAVASLGYVVLAGFIASAIAGPDSLRQLLHAVSVPELILAESFILLGHVLLALRWRALLRGTDPVELPLTSAIGIQLSAQICNVALPLLGGDLAASWILERRLGVPYARSIAASIYARLTGLLTCGGIAACSVLVLLGGTVSSELGAGVKREVLAVALFTIPVLAISAFPRPLVALGEHLERWGSRVASEGASRRVQRLGQGTMMLAWWLHTTATRDWRQVLQAVVWSALNFVLMAVPAMMIASALGLSPTPLEALAVVSSGSLGNIATVIVPGAGLVEEVTIFALANQLMGASAGAAALFALALLVLRVGPLLLGIPAVLYYFGGARQSEMEGLWQGDIQRIIAQLSDRQLER